jgi:hypothetical protein
MGKGSSSSNETVSKSTNFNNIDYGDGGGSGGSLAKNINLADSSLSVGDVISTDHGAVSGAFELASEVNQGVIMLGDMAYDDVANSRDFAGELFGGAVDSVNAANREAMQFLSQGTDRALAFATQSTRSESGQTVETLTKYLLIGGVSIAGLILLKNRGA